MLEHKCTPRFIVLNNEHWTCMARNRILGTAHNISMLWFYVLKSLKTSLSNYYIMKGWTSGMMPCSTGFLQSLTILGAFRRVSNLKMKGNFLVTSLLICISWWWTLLSGWKVRTNFPLEAMTSPSGSTHNGLGWKIGLPKWLKKSEKRRLLWVEVCEDRRRDKYRCWWPVLCWRDSPSCW